MYAVSTSELQYFYRLNVDGVRMTMLPLERFSTVVRASCTLPSREDFLVFLSSVSTSVRSQTRRNFNISRLFTLHSLPGLGTDHPSVRGNVPGNERSHKIGFRLPEEPYALYVLLLALGWRLPLAYDNSRSPAAQSSQKVHFRHVFVAQKYIKEPIPVAVHFKSTFS